MEDDCGKPVENVDKFRKMAKIKGWRTIGLWISLWTVWMKPPFAYRPEMQEAAFFTVPLCSPKAHARLSMPGKKRETMQRAFVLRDGGGA